ncbi:MAG TPA: phosphoribosylanthranilate isomerase [Coleofasciculaceae cyanobacterium]|jgi:phosphoribosylanthranilate isomerase
MRKPGTRTLIKVCGITNPDDAMAAVEAGADYLGLIFVPISPRSVSETQVQAVVETVRRQNHSVKLVGVFQNALPAEMGRMIGMLGLDLVQLHGDESLKICEALPVPVIKALTIQPGMLPEAVIRLLECYAPSTESNIRSVLLDTPKTADATTHSWVRVADLLLQERVQARLRAMRYFLAGGLVPETVGQVVEDFLPDGVDVASGVESAPGQKDHDKLRAFCRAVRHVENAGVQ